MPGPKDAAFSKEAYAIKSREKDPAKAKPAMRELASRLGYPVPPQESPASQAVPGPVSGEVSSEVSGEGIRALGKAAASRWTQTRAVNVIYHFGNSRLVTVPSQAVLQVTSAQVDGASDPMVLGFYKSVSSGNASAYWVKFVGYNDDFAPGNLNSRFTWTNNTGATKTIRIVSWSYPGTAGATTLAHTVTQTGRRLSAASSTMWVSGSLESLTHIPSDFNGCAGPQASQVGLTKISAGSAAFGSSLVAFNENTMEGAFIRDTQYALQLNTTLLQGGSSFLLGFFEGDGYQPSPMDESPESLDQLDAHYGYPFYTAWQKDRFDCP
jgi:hypothetical protein